MPKVSVSVIHAARIVGRHRSTIQRWIKVGKLHKDRNDMIDAAAPLRAAKLPADTPIELPTEPPPSAYRQLAQMVDELRPLTALVRDLQVLADRLQALTEDLQRAVRQG